MFFQRFKPYLVSWHPGKYVFMFRAETTKCFLGFLFLFGFGESKSIFFYDQTKLSYNTIVKEFQSSVCGLQNNLCICKRTHLFTKVICGKF